MSGGPGDVKICASCGRTMTWRKAWAKNWDDVRYCSNACRSRKLKAVDHDLEAAILACSLSGRAGPRSVRAKQPRSSSRRLAIADGTRPVRSPATRGLRRRRDHATGGGCRPIVRQGPDQDPASMSDTDLGLDGETHLDDDANDRVHHHARVGDEHPQGPMVRSRRCADSGSRPAPTREAPCCPMCALVMGRPCR